MATWHVSTLDKKSVEEHEFWEKDGQTIIRVTGYRLGSWTITTLDDKEPIFTRVRNPLGDENEDSVDMNNLSDENIEDVELESLDDGWYADIVYPDDFDEDEQEELTDIFEEDSYEGWERKGWMQTDTECWVSCDLQVEKVD